MDFFRLDIRVGYPKRKKEFPTPKYDFPPLDRLEPGCDMNLNVAALD
jgi:hypothetical protein